jgi:uncharacterized protein YuzE
MSYTYDAEADVFYVLVAEEQEATMSTIAQTSHGKTT